MHYWTNTKGLPLPAALPASRRSARACCVFLSLIMVNEADSIGGDADIRIALKETSEQRDGFRENVDVLMAEVLRLREQSTTLQDHLSATERSHNEARSQWAAKLEQAQHEFSDMLTREDLEAMREDLVQQTEAPWKARVKALETELATARSRSRIRCL